MLRFHIVTLFPSFFDSVLQAGLMGRALEKGIISVDMVDPRDFSPDRHRHVDDRPYGGSPGMVMQLAPVSGALRSIASPGRMLAMAPNGRPARQELARELAAEGDITILCGRYEGFDARLYDLFPLEPVSVGDMVLNGGETAALALIEAVSRLVPGFMGKTESGEDESFSAGLLEYPHYTRPPVFEGLEVPAVLQQGNHAEIADWRRRQSLAATLARRPDLLDLADINHEDARTLRACPRQSCAPNIHLWLVDEGAPPKWQKTVHGPILDRDCDELAAFAKTIGLGGFAVLDPEPEQSLEAHLERRLADLQGTCGAEPAVCAVAPWPRRGPALSAVQLRALAGTGPLVLLAGRAGFLGKGVLKQCAAHARPIRFLDGTGRLGGRETLVMLLDRVLGDWH